MVRIKSLKCTATQKASTRWRHLPIGTGLVYYMESEWREASKQSEVTEVKTDKRNTLTAFLPPSVYCDMFPHTFTASLLESGLSCALHRQPCVHGAGGPSQLACSRWPSVFIRERAPTPAPAANAANQRSLVSSSSLGPRQRQTKQCEVRWQSSTGCMCHQWRHTQVNALRPFSALWQTALKMA